MKKNKRRAKPGAKERGGKGATPSMKDIAKLKALVLKELDSMSADHESYFDGFIAGWECATENIGNVADAFSMHSNAGFTDEHIRAFVKPYSIGFSIMYSRIIGTFAAHERELFLATINAHKSAWCKLCAALEARHPKFAAECGTIKRNSALAAEYLFRMYVGEIGDTLTPEYLGWMDSLLAALAAIRKDVLP